MAKHVNTAKVNIPMCIAAFLLCLTLFSAHFTSGLYAKYLQSSSAGDSAKVITFGDLTLTETGDFYREKELLVIPGVDLQKKVVVDFEGSESATYVFVEITAAKWNVANNNTFSISSGDQTAMHWSIADNWTFLSSADGTHVFYRELAPNTQLNQVDIIANNGKITVSEHITRNEIQALTDVSIKFRASVVQSGGFDNPMAAWNSFATKEGGND